MLMTLFLNPCGTRFVTQTLKSLYEIMNARGRFFDVCFLPVGFYKTDFWSERANVVKVKVISHFENNLSLYVGGVASFLTSCRPD